MEVIESKMVCLALRAGTLKAGVLGPGDTINLGTTAHTYSGGRTTSATFLSLYNLCVLLVKCRMTALPCNSLKMKRPKLQPLILDRRIKFKLCF